MWMSNKNRCECPAESEPLAETQPTLRRFPNATSSLASAALKLCTELANYWRSMLSDGWRPNSFWFRCAIRIGCAARRDGCASHVAPDGDATTVCLDAGRRRL